MPGPIPDPDRTLLDPTPEAMRQVGYAFVDRVVDYLASLPEQPVARRRTGSELASLVDEPLPREPASLIDCLDFFFENAVPGMTRVNHPRFHAYIPCPSSFPGALGEMLAAATNPFTGSWLGGSTVCALELTVLRWITELLGYEPKSGGILTSGGSTANLIGLASARARYPESMERGRLYVSREGHASVLKAAAILGFRADAVTTIPVDDQFRMQTDALRDAITSDRQAGRLPFFVAANAGTTNTGAIDDLPGIADLCQSEDLWFHIDAAYGGFAALVPEGRARLQGMDRADSLTLDPHKWLYCPMGTGCALVREPEYMERAFSSDANYLKDLPPDEVNFLNRGPELSRPARVLGVWMVMRSVGADGLAAQIQSDMKLAQLAATLLREDTRLDVLEPGLSIVPFRHRAHPGETEDRRSARDDRLMEAVLHDGELMLSTTYLGEMNTLRLVVMNHRTTESDIRRSVTRIRELIEE